MKVEPCVVCGTETGWYNQKTRIPYRDDLGQCLCCKNRGGKPRSVNPCIECGDPAGGSRIVNGRIYIIRAKGRCQKCSSKYYRQRCRGTKAASPTQQRSGEVVKIVPERPPIDAATEMCEREKRVRSKRWVQEYRRATRWWNSTAKKTGKRVKVKATA